MHLDKKDTLEFDMSYSKKNRLYIIGRDQDESQSSTF